MTLFPSIGDASQTPHPNHSPPKSREKGFKTLFGAKIGMRRVTKGRNSRLHHWLFSIIILEASGEPIIQRLFV